MSSLGTILATGIPKACPQFLTSTVSSFIPIDILTKVLDTPLFQTVTDAGEDCLTINVQRPSTASAGSNLPVVYWIFGGGFEFGPTQTYDATDILSTAISQGKPFIYVSVNYRVGGFGFLPGKEILEDGSANLGLLDQRLGLQWVADNIVTFGGDPLKVTIWEESAGSISVFDQMALYGGNNTYKGKPLFRAGIMDSGSVIPADSVDCPKGQVVYDTVVDAAGCSGSSDTLSCLRSLDYQTYLTATASVPAIFDYSSVALSYLPRPDGAALVESPELIAEKGTFAQVPFIIGDQEDEGTLFSLVQFNISTTAELVNYLSTVFFHDATVSQIEQLVSLYPDDPSDGSPFDTGILNEVYPEYKRIAAILGDLTFTLTCRLFLSYATQVHPSVPVWSYLNSYLYGTPVLGTFHGSDILTTYGILPSFTSISMQTYYINFFTGLDPNAGTVAEIEWPQWSAGNELLNFQALSNELLKDDFRSEAYAYLGQVASSLHI